jgi:hypothetical protein
MRQFLCNLLFSITAFVSFSAHAELLGKDKLPAPVIAELYKKHPNAADITGQAKKHYKQDLYEIHFKDGEEHLIELYRKDGHFFVSASVIDPSGMLPPSTLDNLKAEFTNYEVKEALLVTNPNGAGEEFDFTINSAGVDWSVTVDGEGKIVAKEQN